MYWGVGNCHANIVLPHIVFGSSHTLHTARPPKVGLPVDEQHERRISQVSTSLFLFTFSRPTPPPPKRGPGRVSIEASIEFSPSPMQRNQRLD